MKRWEFGLHQTIGPTFVQFGVGVRVTVADTALALFVNLLFFEVMVQFNLKEPEQLGKE
jgi:hypothetical protein